MGNVPIKIFCSTSSWRKSELQGIDRKTRTLFTLYGALHPKSDVYRMYKEGGRGLISIEDCVSKQKGVWKCMFMEMRKD